MMRVSGVSIHSSVPDIVSSACSRRAKPNERVRKELRKVARPHRRREIRVTAVLRRAVYARPA